MTEEYRYPPRMAWAVKIKELKEENEKLRERERERERMIKASYRYLPRERIQDGCLYPSVYVFFTFLWWVRTLDLECALVKRWYTKKEFRKRYRYWHPRIEIKWDGEKE